jgi:adenosylcobinamide-GDP ribazoletransferase
MNRLLKDVLVAFQFLTRLPLPQGIYDPDALARSARYFPLVGAFVGAVAALVYRFLLGHLPVFVVAVAVLGATILLTGGLHEDALADVADGFGGGWNREQILLILKDSRIGSYGAIALVLSLVTRLFLLASVPAHRFFPVVLCAQVLCRWTTLPLGYLLKPARANGQGARIASSISLMSLVLGSIFSLVISIYLLHERFWIPVSVVVIITALSGLYYHHRIGGITGDCFGTTIQLTEIAVYLWGVWQ